jgi:hypothetical protein
LIKRISGWLVASLVLTGAPWPATAQNTPTGTSSAPPAASRSRTTGNSAEHTAQVHCLALATSAFQTYSGPQVARENGAGAFFMSCMMRQMPNDWPNAADVRDQATRMADIARRADPSIDACLLTACTAPPKDEQPASPE